MDKTRNNRWSSFDQYMGWYEVAAFDPSDPVSDPM